MPVPRVWVGKGTDYSTSSQTPCDQRVIVNVDVVIEVDKIMPNCLTKDRPRDRAQKEVNQNDLRARRCLPATLQRKTVPLANGSGFGRLTDSSTMTGSHFSG